MSVNIDSFGAMGGLGSVAASARQTAEVSAATHVHLSAFGKAWKMPANDATNLNALLDLVDGSSVVAKLLIRRGITERETAQAFLFPEHYVPTSPMELPDVDKAILRVTQAIAENQHITVYGDYDVDGVTGTSVLLTVLRKLGASVDFYIPNRSAEGYGLNLKAVSVLASKHRTKLIITCDCGVSNFAEVNFAKSLGVDTLILDHHSMPEMMPPAVGIIHPKRLPETHPLFDLPGVGVAYKVCEALLIDKDMNEEVERLLDFVTLGMIADLVPLIRENRYLVQIGLSQLLNTQRPGLQALLKQVHRSEDTDIVGFGLAPRINAVGRLSDAKAAVELMTTDDPSLSENLARQLQTENVKRQELCEKIFWEADHLVQRKNLDSERAIAIYSEEWHHGVVGIVASRLVEKYHRPVFIGELDESEGMIRGSARGVEGIDLYQALKLNEALLLRWGGHKMAAGFSLESAKGESFCTAIVQTCNKLMTAVPSNPVVNIDLSVGAAEVTQDLAHHLTKLAPFGMANKKPLLHVTNLRCLETRPLGRESKHHRITVKGADCQTYFEAVLWNSRGRIPSPEEEIEIVFTPEINSFNGRKRLQLVLSDWRGKMINDGSAKSEEIGLTMSTTARGDTGAVSQGSGKAVNDERISQEAVPEFAPGDDLIDCKPGENTRVAESAAALELTMDTNVDSVVLPDERRFENPKSSTITISDSANAPGENEDRLLAATKLQRLSSDSQQSEGSSNSLKNNSPVSSKGLASWQIKDLRAFAKSKDVLAKARQRFGGSLQIFSEPAAANLPEMQDRTMLKRSEHLLMLNFPPSLKVLQEILGKVSPTVVYIVGQPNESDSNDASAFLKRLYGLVRYAVNRKDGQVEGEKLAALMSSTKMSLALGLTILRKCNLIDWFAEDGCLFLDIIGELVSTAGELPEHKQLVAALGQSAEFRHWCQTADSAELELAMAAAS